jgi:uncharacterized protein (TIGR00730 family)
MRRLCVFCGSAVGARAEYALAAQALGTALGRCGIGLVYGGGSVGLMGLLADAVRAAGGETIGVIPRGLASKEVAHAGLTELRVVGSMHERKALMASLADGFVGMPGGLGTLEEICEMLTWAQLGIHRKPVALLDVAGYWAGLRALLAHAITEGFVDPASAGLLLVATTPDELLDRLSAWQPDGRRRVWLDSTQA